MTTGPKSADIRLSGGPGDRKTFSREEWATRILAAHRMGRTTPTGAGWALGYERSPEPGVADLAAVSMAVQDVGAA